MRLSTFLRSHKREILDAWETFARELGSEAGTLDVKGLRDHAAEMLEAIANDMDAEQSERESAAKPTGERDAQRMGRSAAQHGAMRIEQGFLLTELVSEFRALRSSAVRLWCQTTDSMDEASIAELIRFNEAVDQAISESVEKYGQESERSRTLLLGVLGHDLRNPLGAIMMSAQVLLRRVHPVADVPHWASQIVASAERMKRLIDDLLTFAEERMGGGMALHARPADLDPICRRVIDEIVASLGPVTIDFRAEDDLHGSWDEDRIAQMLGNLVANAVQHGERSRPVTVRAIGKEDSVEIHVHNDGPPIPAATRAALFDPFSGASRSRVPGEHFGLGLYVVSEIAKSHGGETRVASNESEGTTFTVVLPRHRAGVTSVDAAT